MNPSAHHFDILRDSFLRFVAEGMSHEEALEEFDKAEFRLAASAEIEGGGVRIVGFEEAYKRGELDLAGSWITNDERMAPSLFELLAKAGSEHRNGVHGADYQQALALWQAGWTSESQRPDSQVMSWYWRAPSKRPGKPGRKYLSTNQAHKALNKESAQ